MPDVELPDPFLALLDALDDAERAAVGSMLDDMIEGRVPLVRDGDVSVQRPGAQVVGRPIPGTDLVLSYVPGPDIFFVVDIERRDR